VWLARGRPPLRRKSLGSVTCNAETVIFQASESLPAIACHVVYQPMFAWGFPAVGILGSLVGAAVAWKLRGPKRRTWALVSGLALLWALAIGVAAYVKYLGGRSMVASTETSLVEGVVRDFSPGEFLGHKQESFWVNGVRFAYQDDVYTGGFNHDAGRGGPMREGLFVRIRYVPSAQPYGNLILHLEICR